MTGEQITERINRHQLVRLLDTMTTVERQAITHRMIITELQAAANAGCAAESPRKHPRPPSQVAAMLPPVKPLRSARPTLTGRTLRPVDPDVAIIHAPAPPTLDAPQIVLSPQVVAQLSTEEMAMLPPHLQPPQFQPVAAPIALAAPPRGETVSPPLAARSWIALAALFAIALVVFLAVHLAR